MIDGIQEVSGRTQPTPARRLFAAGIKRTGQPWLVEQPQQSTADQAAHVAASYVRPRR